MSIYTTVFSASVPIGGLAAGALASVAGIPLTIAVGGVLSLAAGAGAFVWWRRLAPTWRPAARPAGSGDVMGTAPRIADPGSVGTGRPTPQSLASGAPNTSAAFNPPNPNEVLSTRR
jgi:hypothetical protein